jgi:lysophospholipase L1-like esterase
VNAKLQALASRHSWLRYVDCADALIAHAYSPASQLAQSEAAVSPPPPPMRYLPPHLMYDLLHLTPEGYQLWAACLGPHVARAVEGVMEADAHKQGEVSTSRHTHGN